MARLIEKREMFNAAIVTAMDCGDQLSPVCYTARNTAFDGYSAYIVEVMHSYPLLPETKSNLDANSGRNTTLVCNYFSYVYGKICVWQENKVWLMRWHRYKILTTLK